LIDDEELEEEEPLVAAGADGGEDGRFLEVVGVCGGRRGEYEENWDKR
jgi:hypothetical protein